MPKRGHARIYSAKDIVGYLVFDRNGYSGKRRIMVMALEPEEGKATFTHEIIVLHKK